MWGGVMIKRIVAFALFQPLFLLVLAGLCIVGGIVAFKSLPIEAFPDVTDIQVAVISLFPGHAAEEVEKQVTALVQSDGNMFFLSHESFMPFACGKFHPPTA